MSADGTGHWYPVALATEVTGAAPGAVRCAGRQIVLFRDTDRVARALEDRCAHRRAPLSLGKIMSDGLLACPYHGWRYEGATGRCRVIPNLATHEAVPSIFRVEHFAISERGPFLYLWSGSAESAIEAALPAPGLFAGIGAEYGGSALLTIAHGDFLAAMLDSPDLVFSLGDCAVVPFHPHGDPRTEGGMVVIERAADFASALATRAHALPDYPFRLRISLAPHCSTARLDLETEMGAPVFAASIASSPAAGSVTAVHWTANAAGFAIRPYVDPAGLLALVPQASAHLKEHPHEYVNGSRSQPE
jgi:nitrite reductase/ring-hydroxylating ferredoxin subunit